jgi:hypothetical protein
MVERRLLITSYLFFTSSLLSAQLHSIQTHDPLYSYLSRCNGSDAPEGSYRRIVN